jgi:hypothetical protein
MAEAIALITAGLGKAEIEFASSVTAPLLWELRGDGDQRLTKGGSAFFLDTGESLFAVTAAHVVEECFADTRSRRFVQCRLAGDGRSLPISLGDRIIDGSAEIDIATFQITASEVAFLGKIALSGFQKTWPPRLPQLERGVTYCGYPGNGRRWLGPREMVLGCVAAGGLVSSVTEITISILIERHHLSPVLGQGIVPENYDFGGISGGSMIAIVQTPTLRSWMPAGVIVQGPNTAEDASQAIGGLDIIKARPINFILPNGDIDLARWQMLDIQRGALRKGDREDQR